MKLVVGMGNPSKKYEKTRHNLGFMVVERFVREVTSKKETERIWKEDKKSKSLVANLKWGVTNLEEKVVVVKPQTFMNNSGFAVKKLVTRYLSADRQDQVIATNLVVIHDDIDLPLGKIRIRKGGAAGGHHGVESVIDSLKTSNFIRLRLGVGRGLLDKNKPRQAKNLHRREVERFITSPFFGEEIGEVRLMLKRATKALLVILKKGLGEAMNRFN